MRIAIKTLGCKLNQAESDELKENLLKEGFFVVGWKNKADIYIVNACSLTSGAEQGVRQVIHQIHRQNPKSQIFVTGCYNQNLPEVTAHITNHKKLIEKLKNLKSESTANKYNAFARRCENVILQQNKTRAFIKIQTGCDNFCSYCIIPYFRGKPKSISPKKIIDNINQKTAQNFKEIVLTGVNICKYNWRGLNLTNLVKKILSETTIQRIRFSSLDPSLIDDEFIMLFQNQRIMPHMHLSLQSGSDKILKAMNRKYTASQYLSLVKKIKKHFPLMGFTTDIIVGFPGETERDFKETCDLVKKIGFLKIHIFPFSPRPGTKASLMTNQINKKIKKERFLRLQNVSNITKQKFIQKIIGKQMSVLFEEKKDDAWFGYTPNYLRVKIKCRENLKNKILDVIINSHNIRF